MIAALADVLVSALAVLGIVAAVILVFGFAALLVKGVSDDDDEDEDPIHWT